MWTRKILKYDRFLISVNPEKYTIFYFFVLFAVEVQKVQVLVGEIVVSAAPTIWHPAIIYFVRQQVRVT